MTRTDLILWLLIGANIIQLLLWTLQSRVNQLQSRINRGIDNINHDQVGLWRAHLRESHGIETPQPKEEK